MNSSSEIVYADVVENVAKSFGNIVEVLCSLRKWKCVCSREMVSNCIRSYLEDRPSQFWSEYENNKENQRSGICSGSVSRDIIRSIDRTLNIRNRSQEEILNIFSDAERFCKIMKGQSDFLKEVQISSTDMSKETKVCPDAKMACKDERTVKVPINGKNRGGLPRIGPRTRLYGSNLSKAQENANLKYWTDHQEELYNG